MLPDVASIRTTTLSFVTSVRHLGEPLLVQVTLTNSSDETREIELTSYGEIVLAMPEADRIHPAFGNLFVETEWHDWCTAITATRRPRSSKEQPLWCVHVVDTGRHRVGPVTYETDRARFLGRGRSTRDPMALEEDGALSGTTGSVLDPIFALRTRIRLERGQSASVAFTTLVATSRDRAFELADRYRDSHAAQRALDLAWTSSQVELREFHLSPSDAAVFQELAGHLLYGSAALRAPQAELRRNRGSQPLLWRNGVSGDWPILLVSIDSADGLPTLRQILTVGFWIAFIVLLVSLLEDRKNPDSEEVEIEGPAFARFLFNNSRAGLFWLPIRLFVGFTFFEAGLHKLFPAGKAIGAELRRRAFV